MNEVKVFCPNCQEAVFPVGVTEKYSVLERLLHAVLAMVALFATGMALSLCVVIVGFFLVVPMFRWFKRECAITFTGKKASAVVCPKCNVML